MIVLAHYFANRRLVQMTPELRARLIADGVLEAEPNPLYLPGHAVRLLIILAFVALAVYLARHDRLFDPVALPIFIALGSYFLGLGFSSATMWWNKGKRPAGATRFDDIRAIATLVAMSLVIAVHLLGWQNQVPYAQKLEALPLALMLFYFGSR